LGFEQDLIHAIFKLVWRRRARKGSGGGNEEGIHVEVISWPPRNLDVQFFLLTLFPFY